MLMLLNSSEHLWSIPMPHDLLFLCSVGHWVLVYLIFMLLVFCPLLYSVWPHNVHCPFPWTLNRALWNCSWITNNLIVQVPVSASSGYSSLPPPCPPPLILLLQIKKNPFKNLFASGGWKSLSHKPVLGFSTQSYQQLRGSSSSSSSLSIQARASSSSSLDLWYCNRLDLGFRV
jgi:hypothetical protein